jgi:hypothetical protein
MGKQTDRYENASKAYQNAMDKYAGEAGWKLALEQGKSYSTTAGDVARSSGYKAARTAGYGKAASYALANDAANSAANSSLQAGLSAAQNNNTSTIGMHGTNVQNQAGLDQMEYQQGRDGWGIGLQTAGQIVGAFSDENLKTIYRDELTIDWLSEADTKK